MSNLKQCLFITCIYIQAINFGFLPALAPISLTLHEPRAASLIFVSYITGFTLIQLINGLLYRKLGANRLFMSSILMACIGLTSAALIPFFIFILASFAIIGCCTGLLIANINTIAHQETALEDQKNIFSMINILYAIGAIIAPSIADLIIHFVEWQALLLILGGLGVILFIYFNSRLEKKINITEHPSSSSWKNDVSVLIQRNVLCVILIGSLFVTVEKVYFMNLTYLLLQMSNPIKFTSAFIILPNLAMGLGLGFATFVHRLLSTKRIISLSCLMGCLFILVLLTLTILYKAELLTFILAICGIFFIIGMATPSYWFIALNSHKEMASTISGYLTFAQNSISTLVCYGLILGDINTLTIFSVMAALLGITVLVQFFLKSTSN